MAYLFELGRHNPAALVLLSIFSAWLVALFFTPLVEGKPTEYEDHDAD